jgi:hypothetical protein
MLHVDEVAVSGPFLLLPRAPTLQQGAYESIRARRIR